MTDQEMIEALKAKGYRVIEDKRVRVVTAQGFISIQAILQTPNEQELARLRSHVDETTARSLGMRLFEDGIAVRGRTNVTEGEQRRAQVMVVLPHSWDFEQEMWGIRR